MQKEVVKKINLQLVGMDGNAFFLMGAFRRQAQKEGWEEDEIKIVMDEAKTGNYAQLRIKTLDKIAQNCII